MVEKIGYDCEYCTHSTGVNPAQVDLFEVVDGDTTDKCFIIKCPKCGETMIVLQ